MAPASLTGQFQTDPLSAGLKSSSALTRKVNSHVQMVAIWTVWYNWVRIHKSLRVTPAIQANLTDTVWSSETIVAKMDEFAPKAGRPKSYWKKVE